jgi:hypothetical protein
VPFIIFRGTVGCDYQRLNRIRVYLPAITKKSDIIPSINTEFGRCFITHLRRFSIALEKGIIPPVDKRLSFYYVKIGNSSQDIVCTLLGYDAIVYKLWWVL